MAQLASKFSLLSLLKSKPIGLVETSEGYLNLAKQCMERVERMTLLSVSTVKFNHGQCRYLAEKLKLAVRYAFYVVAPLNSDPVGPLKDMVGCLEVFKLLYALAMEVENIIQSCCRDAWTLAAVTLTDVSEHISSIGFDLELLTLVFSQRKTSTIVDDIFKAEVKVVKEQASVDKETLLRDLHALLQRKKLSVIEHERASLLLKRLERSRLTLSGDSVGSSESIRSETVMSSLKQLESLGKGSASTVYRATWLGAEFAKKTFYGPNSPDFEKEVSILTGLSHPYIAPLIWHGKDKRECSIVMELMDGDLFTLMQGRLKDDDARDTPFGMMEAVDIMHQLAEGMQFLHEMKIVHRDLKSMNVLVKCVKSSKSKVEYVQIKVADFGMSRIKEMSMTYSNQTVNVGTTRWMAPEIIRCLDSGSQANGESLVVQYPFKCDVYSFAMVCYEILSGNIPFSNIYNSREVKKMVLDGGHPELPTECPELLKNLIGRCWSLSARQRPKFGEICAKLRHLKSLLLSMPFASSNISPPLNKSLQAGDSTPSGSKSRGSSSLAKPTIFDSRITPNMLAFLDKKDSLAGCRVLGKGEHGRVYRVPLQDDLVVAIMCFRDPFLDDYLGQKYYWYFESLGFLRHRNLVPLLAYVSTTDFHYFVYEFVPGGSLEDALDQMAARKLTLSWPQRHRILCGVARCLSYLHGKPLRSYHVPGNLKPANILLDEGYEAKIGDFSLAALNAHVGTHRVPAVFYGMDGFVSPECLLGGRYSRESDVFSYGVVIAQLVTGRSPADQFVVENGGSIGQWLHKCLQSSDGAMEAIDPALRSSGYVSEILRAMEVAVSCTNRRPTQRPTSTAALKMLLQIRNPDTVPGKDHRRRRLNQHLSHSHAQISGHRVHQMKPVDEAEMAEEQDCSPPLDTRGPVPGSGWTTSTFSSSFSTSGTICGASACGSTPAMSFEDAVRVEKRQGN